jgi:hypothetical protein
MKELPILFSAPMIRAILDGRKTQTRRLLDLRRSVGTPETPEGCLLQLWYPGAKLHYGYEVDDGDGVQRSWQVQRLCGPGCEPSPKEVYPPTGHVDWAGPVDGYPGPYDGRHPVSWGPLRFWPGLRLWVKETWQPIWASDVQPPHGYASLEGWKIGYVATDGVKEWHDQDTGLTSRCKPSIFMPRAFSRITLEVTGVRIERLHDISEADARAEGVLPIAFGEEAPGRTTFAELWNRLNEGKAPWKSNPWVSVVSFRRVTQ